MAGSRGWCRGARHLRGRGLWSEWRAGWARVQAPRTAHGRRGPCWTEIVIDARWSLTLVGLQVLLWFGSADTVYKRMRRSLHARPLALAPPQFIEPWCVIFEL